MTRRGAGFLPPLLGLLLLATASACGGRHLLAGLFGARDGTLLVRQQRADSLVVWADEDRLGVADSGGVACFRDVKTGTLRLRATVPGDTLTVRATDAVLTPEDPLLWDVDHDQVLDGRTWAGLCASRD